MAFNASTEWEVRTTGNDANGGGFNTASAGTDYSQQDAAQVAYTDLVIGATTTQLSSALNPFTSAHVGNIINVTGGTGFTVQRVQVNSVAGGVATCDKACGTAGSTGGTGNLGGGLATIAAAAALIVAGNKIHIKSGTYTLTSVVSLGAGVKVIGYETSHLDFGAKPVITTATDGTELFNTGNGSSSNGYTFANLSLSNTAGTRAIGVRATFGNAGGLFYRCVLDGFTIGISISNTWTPYLGIVETEIKNCSSHGAANNNPVFVIDSYIHNNGGNGINLTMENANAFFALRSIFANNTGDGVSQGNNAQASSVYRAFDCIFAGNGGDGLQTGGGGGGASAPVAVMIENNIFWDNGGYGVRNPIAPQIGFINRANAYGSNGTAAVLNMPAGSGDVTLTADPFTDAANGDYSLNDSAGGGAACKAAGFPGAFPGGTTTGYLDIGAVQSAGSSPAGSANSYGWMW